MKPIRFLVAALALLGLSACYTSRDALVGEDAVAPFAEITFKGRGDGSDPVAFVREGNAYVTHAENGDMWLHLKPVEGDYHVAQLGGTGDDGETEYLYGYLRIDTAAGVAEAWKSVGSKSDVRPGLSECDDLICIDDLDAYIAYAREAIAAGEEPETVFDIVTK